MPTVPKAERQVQRAPLRGVQQSGADRSAFGSGIAKGLNAVNSVVLDQLAVQNETKAKELDVEFSKSLRAMQFDPKSGYYAKRGEDAYKYQPLFEQATEELRKTFLEQAENVSQASMLDKVMQARITRARDGVSRHAMKEYQSWVDNASNARAEDSLQEAIVNYNDTKFVNQLRTSGRNEIITVGQRNGKDQEVINAELKDYDSKLHAGTVQHLIQLDTKEARAYFDEHKDDIDGRVQYKLLRSLKIAEKGDLATSREDYAVLSKMAAFEVDKFIHEDLAKYELSDADFKKFENSQVSAQRSKSKHDEKYSGIKRAMGLASNTLKAAGIKTTGKLSKKKARQLDQFQGELLLDIKQWESENKRAPNDQETLGIIDSLLIKGRVPGTGIAGFFQDEPFLFEDESAIVNIDEVPNDMKIKIISRFNALHKRQPTEKEIETSYTNYILKRKVGQ